MERKHNILNIIIILLTSLLLYSCNYIEFVSHNSELQQSLVAHEEESSLSKEELSLPMLEKLAINGDGYASLQLGEAYLNGTNEANKNILKALDWFKKSAKQNLPIAMVKIGNIYRDGLLGVPDLSQAISWYEQSANLGNIQAMLNLGEIYRGWYGMIPDYNKAADIYNKAASMGSLEAEYQMVRLVTNQLVDDIKYAAQTGSIMQSLHQAAEAGNAEAMVGLGDYYMKQPNFSLAIKYYEQAAEQKFAPALLSLGLLYFHGEGVTQNYTVASKYFTEAADLDNVVAQYYLGDMYNQGLGVETDAFIASKWFALAANKNFAKAVLKLGHLYFYGRGVEPDLYKAIELYNKAAIMGDSYSALLLSIFYAKGLGVEQDLAKSMQWYNFVERKKDKLLAKFEIAKSYECGIGFKIDKEEALKWYLLAADQGLAKAQAKLGDLYASNNYNNYKESFKWYKKAADQGYNYAQYSLGLLLPKISEKNKHTAHNWMKKAALSGYKPAQYNIALMYLHGNGVRTNAVKAYAWLSIAINDNSTGLESNPEMMNIIVNNLEPDARNKAILLVKHYQEKYNIDNKNSL